MTHNSYVIDACALVAFLRDEPGSDKMSDILREGGLDVSSLCMNKLNLLEVYYGSLREYGAEKTAELFKIIADSPIRIIPEISDAVFQEAGRLKAAYRISLADSIALAEASVNDATLVTCDHHEFDAVEKSEPIKFSWIR